MHPVDSNDISFKIAGMMAFKQAFQQADPQLLEPIYHVEVLCPDDLTGAVMGDLQTRRAMWKALILKAFPENLCQSSAGRNG